MLPMQLSRYRLVVQLAGLHRPKASLARIPPTLQHPVHQPVRLRLLRRQVVLGRRVALDPVERLPHVACQDLAPPVRAEQRLPRRHRHVRHVAAKPPTRGGS